MEYPTYHGINYNDYWIDDWTRQPWAEQEIFSINYWLIWTHYYFVRVSLSFPTEIRMLADRYENSHHWWDELCHLTPFLLRANTEDESEIRNI